MKILNKILKGQYVAMDCETTGLNPRKDAIIFFGCYDGKQFLTYQSPQIDSYLADENVVKVFHNAGFDIQFLRNSGLEVKGPVVCTLLLAQMVNENQDLSLKALMPGNLEMDRKLNEWLRIRKIPKSKMYKAPDALILPYLEEDCRNTFQLAKILTDQIIAIENKFKTMFPKAKHTPVSYYEEEAMGLEPVLWGMSGRGIKIDVTLVREELGKLHLERDKIIDGLNQLLKNEIENGRETFPVAKTGPKRGNTTIFNWNSTKQIGWLYFDKLGLSKFFPGAKTATGQWKCDTLVFSDAIKLESLPERTREACRRYLDLAALRKKIGTGLEGLLSEVEDGRLYSTFKQVGGDEDNARGTRTGRLSSSRNVQNLADWEKKFYGV